MADESIDELVNGLPAPIRTRLDEQLALLGDVPQAQRDQLRLMTVRAYLAEQMRISDASLQLTREQADDYRNITSKTTYPLPHMTNGLRARIDAMDTQEWRRNLQLQSRAGTLLNEVDIRLRDTDIPDPTDSNRDTASRVVDSAVLGRDALIAAREQVGYGITKAFEVVGKGPSGIAAGVETLVQRGMGTVGAMIKLTGATPEGKAMPTKAPLVPMNNPSNIGK